MRKSRRWPNGRPRSRSKLMADRVWPSHAHWQKVEASIRFIESFAPPPPLPEPVTDAEKAALKAIRDAAVAFIETFRKDKQS